MKKCRHCGTTENLHTTTIKGVTYLCNICKDCQAKAGHKGSVIAQQKKEKSTVKKCKFCGTTEDLMTRLMKNQFMTEEKVVVFNTCNTCFSSHVSEINKDKPKSVGHKAKLSIATKKQFADPELKRKNVEARGIDYDEMIVRQNTPIVHKCRICGTTENLWIRKVAAGPGKIKTVTFNICNDCKLGYLSEVNGFKGKHHTDEFVAHKSKEMRQWWHETNEGTKQKQISKENIVTMNIEHPEKQMEGAIKGAQSQTRISSIEVRLAKAMRREHFKFEQQWKHQLGIADFIVKPYIIIFVDGDYWHNYPHRTPTDRKQTKYLQNAGFIVLRFWEKDILENIDGVMNIIRPFYRIKQNKRFLDLTYKEYIKRGK